MKGKLRKIALGMSVLMCAGMIFTCVMPAKAAIQLCDHSITHALLGWSEDYVDKDDYDSVGHYIKRDERGACGICGEEFAIQTVIVEKEDHDVETNINWNTYLVEEPCKKCNYINSFYL